MIDDRLPGGLTGQEFVDFVKAISDADMVELLHDAFDTCDQSFEDVGHELILMLYAYIVSSLLDTEGMKNFLLLKYAQVAYNLGLRAGQEGSTREQV